MQPESSPRSPARRVAVVYNPVAGAGGAARIAERACRVLAERGDAVERWATSGPGGAEALVRDHARDLDWLVVAGGDGTVREALAGLGDERRRVVLAVLPCGNANLVARELGIPLDPDAALEVLADGEPRSIDLATANGELFLGVVGVGWDARAVHHLSRLRRSRLGARWYRWWADSLYLLAGLLALFTWPPPSLRLRVDGRAISRRHRAVVVANFRTYGKGWSMVPDADCANGWLHYQARKRSGPFFILWQILAAMFRRRVARFVSDHGRGREVVVESEQPFHVQVDGDRRDPMSRLEVRVLPGAALALAPVRSRPA